MKLITEESWETQTEILEEEKSGKKDFFITSLNGIQVDLENRNHRLYPGDIMGKEVARYLNEKLKNGTAYGELGHPTNASINEDRISHRFVEIKQVDKNYYSLKAKIKDTPMGKIVKALIDDGEGKMGISTRSVGTLKEKNGVQIVQEDLYLVTAGDIVSDPSAQKAFIQGIYEGVEYDFIDGVLVERVLDNKNLYRTNQTQEEKTKHFIDQFTKIVEWLSKKR